MGVRWVATSCNDTCAQGGVLIKTAGFLYDSNVMALAGYVYFLGWVNCGYLVYEITRSSVS